MRQLHVLGVSEDGATLLLGTSKNATKPTHRIPLDDRLRAAARGQMAAFGSDRAESGLTPKEMQARMREGASVEEVAKAAGVPVARVLPYFVPVEAERDRIVEEARGAFMHRNRGPAATRVLGVAVDAHLQDTTGIKPDSITWTARRRRDGAWVVGVSYLARGRRKAEWLWQPAIRELTPLDPSASRLGADDAVTPKRKPATSTSTTTAKPAAKSGAKKTAKKTAKKAAAAKKAGPARKASTAKKASPARKTAPAKKAPAVKKAAVVKKTGGTRKTAPAKKLAAVKAPARKAPVRKAAPPPVKAVRPPKVTKPRRPRVVAAPEPVEEEGPFYAPAVIKLPVVPVAEPVEQPEEAAAAAEEAAEETGEQAPARKRGQRVPVPSWSDVLLGVSRDDSRRSG